MYHIYSWIGRTPNFRKKDLGLIRTEVALNKIKPYIKYSNPLLEHFYSSHLFRWAPRSYFIIGLLRSAKENGRLHRHCHFRYKIQTSAVFMYANRKGANPHTDYKYVERIGCIPVYFLTNILVKQVRLMPEYI